VHQEIQYKYTRFGQITSSAEGHTTVMITSVFGYFDESGFTQTASRIHREQRRRAWNHASHAEILHAYLKLPWHLYWDTNSKEIMPISMHAVV
jgi:hypothetical protein